MEPVIIRKAERKDIPSINHLTKEMHIYLGKLAGMRFSKKDLKDEEVKPSELKSFYVAEDTKKKKAIGYINFEKKVMKNEWYGDHIYLSEFAVSKGYRGKGIGMLLMKKLVSFCEKRRLNIKVDTLVSNKNTIELYKRLGFIPLGVNFVRRHKKR